MKPLAAILGIACIAWSAAVASEEEILSPHKVTITADGRKPFGEVSATLETTKDGKDSRIKSITLTVDGKAFVVPKEQFGDLRDPLIQTAEFRSETGFDKHPWLYLTFQLAKAGANAPSERQRVYIRYQNGKLMERSIQEPQK
jgi:hypothetical protein